MSRVAHIEHARIKRMAKAIAAMPAAQWAPDAIYINPIDAYDLGIFRPTREERRVLGWPDIGRP